MSDDAAQTDRAGGATGAVIWRHYDWPETQAETDAWARFLAAALRREGIEAPWRLDRAAPIEAVLTAPNLVAAQLCGLYFAKAARRQGSLLGALDYGHEGCRGAEYVSVLVRRRRDAAAQPAAFRGAVAAVSERLSWSGCGALLEATAEAAGGASFFKDLLWTGSHRASIVAVAEGNADIAAIDAATWRIARWAEPRAAELSAIGRTRPAPSPPVVAAVDAPAAPLRRALSTAVATLPPGLADRLGYRAFLPRSALDYDALARRFDRAVAAHGLRSQGAVLGAAARETSTPITP